MSGATQFEARSSGWLTCSACRACSHPGCIDTHLGLASQNTSELPRACLICPHFNTLDVDGPQGDFLDLFILAVLARNNAFGELGARVEGQTLRDALCLARGLKSEVSHNFFPLVPRPQVHDLFRRFAGQRPPIG